MNPESPQPEPRAAPLSVRVIKARHDLRNSLTHILGFSEILLEEIQEQGRDHLRSDLQFIQRTAAQLMEQVSEKLDTPRIEAGHINLSALEAEVCKQAAQIEAATQKIVGALERESVEAGSVEAPTRKGSNDFHNDLMRIAGAAQHTFQLARSSLGSLSELVESETAFFRALGNPLTTLLPALSDSEPPLHTRKEGSILVVDDLEETRELLSRRLSRLGYSVQLADSGECALETVATHPADLILLDILMPGLDGLEVLRRLKANAATRHIPVVMLSSADQIDTVIRCLTLGADDFLPKPFNTTLLMARIESSLSKKRDRKSTR